MGLTPKAEDLCECGHHWDDHDDTPAGNACTICPDPSRPGAGWCDDFEAVGEHGLATA